MIDLAKYEVLTDFRDLQDDDHIYRAGDPYPRKGKVTKKRIDELSSKDNKLKAVVIKEVEENDKG